jgi:hypothetical protein
LDTSRSRTRVDASPRHGQADAVVPGRDPPGIDGSTNELSVRADIVDLWKLFCGLAPERRRQLLQAAAKWQEAMIHWQDRASLSFALMVVACEALKPPGSYNCYHVVEALLGKPTADRLRQHAFPAQRVRNFHLHTGEFHHDELVRMALMSSYQDPSFREAHHELAQLTRAAIVEWLKRQGTFSMPVINSRPLRMQIVCQVLEAARDVGDDVVLAACRRLINADRLGWREHYDPADWRLALAFAEK